MSDEVRFWTATMRRIALFLEQGCSEDGGEWTGGYWEAYELARSAIGLPIKTYPGGFENAHIHWVEQEEGSETCETCEEEEVARHEGLAGG